MINKTVFIVGFSFAVWGTAILLVMCISGCTQPTDKNGAKQTNYYYADENGHIDHYTTKPIFKEVYYDADEHLRIVVDTDTGVEYIIIYWDHGPSITPRLGTYPAAFSNTVQNNGVLPIPATATTQSTVGSVVGTTTLDVEAVTTQSTVGSIVGTK